MPELISPEPLLRHTNIAFQFSGGKDSTAALFALRDQWALLTVYWLNSGDAFPETAAFVRRVAAEVVAAGGRFVEVPGVVNDIIAKYGPPSDLIAADASGPAWFYNIGSGTRLQDRVLCCARSKMFPMHERMVADGITLVVRGQRAADIYKGPLHSGESADGIEFYYPIEGWSDSEVFAWAIEHNVLPPLYSAGLARSGDCMRCSAWLGDRRAAYLAEHHPIAFRDYSTRVFETCRAAEAVIGRVFSEAKAIGDAAEQFPGSNS